MPEAERAEPPDAAMYLWNWFWELHSGRSYGMGGALPLSWADIRAWCRLFCLELSFWEIRILKLMDSAYLSEVNKEKPKPKARKK